MKQSRVGGGVLLKVIAAALLASIAGFGLLGCELELNPQRRTAQIPVIPHQAVLIREVGLEMREYIPHMEL